MKVDSRTCVIVVAKYVDYLSTFECICIFNGFIMDACWKDGCLLHHVCMNVHMCMVHCIELQYVLYVHMYCTFLDRILPKVFIFS